MRGKEKRQGDFLSQAVYDSFIPADHFVYHLRTLLDWEALAAEFRNCYRHHGRLRVPPDVLLRIVIRQYLYGLSDRQMEAALAFIVALKYFADAPRGSPDADAAWGRRNKNISFYRYKHHISVDAHSGPIVASAVIPGNDHEGVVKRAKAVVADKTYDLTPDHKLLKIRGLPIES